MIKVSKHSCSNNHNSLTLKSLFFPLSHLQNISQIDQFLLSANYKVSQYDTFTVPIKGCSIPLRSPRLPICYLRGTDEAKHVDFVFYLKGIYITKYTDSIFKETTLCILVFKAQLV